MKLRIRCFLILRIKGTHKILILRRSESSRHSGQWDIPGGSVIKRVKPMNLMRKETQEEIGLTLFHLTSKLVVVERYSIYHYYSKYISKEVLEDIKLSEEHDSFKLVDIRKLRRMKHIHHSIRIYLKYH